MRRRGDVPSEPPQLQEIVRILDGLGTMLMEIDAKLERIVNLLEEAL